MGLLHDKVALITGAGGGLGRAYALLFAMEGAKVVVNDLGGARDGSGEGCALADRVVAEIVEAGGHAVANYGSVATRADADAMVQQAVDAFGRLDIVVNNAGILRDKTLIKMSDEQWDLVQAVHLRGTFLVTRAAVAAMMKAQSAGRIVNTSSFAGLKGNFGQANYGAAKAGIAGFTRVVALETRKFGITCNAIAPVAKTRMTEDIDMVPDAFEPEDIAPLVAWIASDAAADVTGRVFGAHGSHYFEYLVETTEGVDLGDQRWEPAKVGVRFEAIAQKAPAAKQDAASAEGDARIQALFAALPETLKADRAGDWSAKLVFDVGGAPYSLVIDSGKARYETGAVSGATGKVSFDSPDTLLAMASGKLAPEQAFMGGKVKTDNMGALMKFGQFFDLGKAIGEFGGASPDDAAGAAGVDPDAVGKRLRGTAAFVTPEAIVAFAQATDDENPRYLQGGDEQIAPPIYAVRPLFGVLTEAIRDPDLNADLLRLVHGEQDMRFHRPLKPWDLAAPRAEIASIEEKSSGWLINVRQWLMVHGEMTTEATSGIFVRKAAGADAGGSKGAGKAEGAPTAEPERDVVYEQTQTVARDQPLRYAEASGDHNPIHVDEEVAKAAGHPSVILHGLCTMAFASRAVVDGICDGKPERLRRIACRFSRPVLPGWQLTTRIWKQSEADGVATYGLEVVNQDGDKVLTNGLAEVAPR